MIKVNVRRVNLLLVTRFARDNNTYQASLNMNNITFLLIFVSVSRFYIFRAIYNT